MEKIVIILDFDGLFYSGKDVFCYVPEYSQKCKRAYLGKLSDKEYEMILRENPDFAKETSDIGITNMMRNIKKKYPYLDIDIQEFLDCQEKNICDINLGEAHLVNKDFINSLCAKYPVYVVSNSAQSHILHYMRVLGIEPKVFKKIFTNKFEEFDPTKQHYYEDIIKMENIKPSELFVFGDSQSSDLQPAINIGANAFLCKDAHKLEKLVYESIKNFDLSIWPLL